MERIALPHTARPQSLRNKITINIPAGAFGSEQTVSIQAITNEAHGGRGTARSSTAIAQLKWMKARNCPFPCPSCQARPATSFLTSGWSVNGVEGGGGQFGTVVGDADRWTGRATYTAPAIKPERNTVSVSAQHRPLGDDTSQTLLVANITIVDGTPDCRQLRSMQTLDAELSFDEFSFTATSPDSEQASSVVS